MQLNDLHLAVHLITKFWVLLPTLFLGKIKKKRVVSFLEVNGLGRIRFVILKMKYCDKEAKQEDF